MASYTVSTPTEEGDLVAVSFKGKASLEPKHCYVFQDDINRKIYIWNGMEALAKKKFTASRAASDLRMTLGFTYRIIPMDETFEPKEFFEMLGESPEPVSAPKEPQETRASAPASHEESTIIASAPKPTGSKTQAAPKIDKKPESTGKVTPRPTKTVASEDKSSTPTPSPKEPTPAIVKPKAAPTPRPVESNTSMNSTSTEKPETPKISHEIPKTGKLIAPSHVSPTETHGETAIQPVEARAFWPVSKEMAAAMFDVTYKQNNSVEPQNAIRLIDGRSHEKNYMFLCLTVTTYEKPVNAIFYDVPKNMETCDCSSLPSRIELKFHPNSTTTIPLGLHIQATRSLYFTSDAKCYLNLIGLTLA